MKSDYRVSNIFIWVSESGNYHLSADLSLSVYIFAKGTTGWYISIFIHFHYIVAV